jgi:hypothetical protein
LQNSMQFIGRGWPPLVSRSSLPRLMSKIIKLPFGVAVTILFSKSGESVSEKHPAFVLYSALYSLPVPQSTSFTPLPTAHDPFQKLTTSAIVVPPDPRANGAAAWRLDFGDDDGGVRCPSGVRRPSSCPCAISSTRRSVVSTRALPFLTHIARHPRRSGRVSAPWRRC